MAKFLRGLICLFVWTSVDLTFAENLSPWSSPQMEINEVWRVRREILSVGRENFSTKELDRIKEIEQNYGLTSITSVSLALLKEIQESREDSPDTQAIRISYAQQFSPDLPMPHYLYCRHILTKGFLNDLGECIQGLKQELSTSSGKLLIFSNLTLLSLTAFLFLSSLFFIYLILRYRSSISHHYAHLLKGLSPLTVQLFTLFLFLLSWAGLGWIGPPLLITLLLWKYIGLQERVVTCLLWILSAAIPYALYFPALEINYEAGILPVLEDPLNGTLLQERGTKLGEWLKKNSKDAEALFSLGLIQKKLGKTELARSNFEEAAKAKPGWAKPSVNLANLDYQEGKIDSAISRLQAVISTSPSFLAYYDAAKIFYKQSRLDEGLQANKKAKGLDAGRFADLEQITVNQNDAKKFLIDEKLDPKDLSPRIWEITPQIEVIRTRLHRTYLPALPLPYYWIVIVLNLILSIGMSQLFPVRRVPRPCEKCGLPSCVLCEPMIEHESLCSQCFHMYVRLEAIDLSARRSKENSIRLYRFLREFRERWIGFFLPGMQYLFTDRALAWFFYSLFFLPAVVLILFESFWIESPFTVSNLPHFPYHWIGISLGLFFYLITLTSILRKT